MKVGIPKGLFYYKYYPFAETFLQELGAEIITSQDTNKQILDAGVKYCVDEACLPIKVFHGHVASIKDKCDLLIVPRIMSIRKREYICPKFCGLPEMVVNSISDMPPITNIPIYAYSISQFYKSMHSIGKMVTKDNTKIKRAFEAAVEKQKNFKINTENKDSKIKILLAGHPYNIYDSYINMNLIKKLNNLGANVITEESFAENYTDEYVKKLYKRPFWTFERREYGCCCYASDNHIADGIVYISSFACGIDSVVIELIKDEIGDLPFLVLKIDEHTGEAGLDTRIEAFMDMLERRCLK